MGQINKIVEKSLYLQRMVKTGYSTLFFRSKTGEMQ